MPLDDNSPLYQQIVEDIRQRILSGEFKIGQKIGSHRELTEHYKVSLITVKQALKVLISEGYLRAHAGKGTYINRTAPPTDLTHHRSIGVVIPKLEDPFFHEMLSAIEEEAYQNSYNVLLTISNARLDKTSRAAQKDQKQIQHYRKIGVDGLIVGSLDPSHFTPAVVKELHDANFPYVLVSYVRSPDIYCVTTNQEKGAYLATKYLIDQGYDSIGYVGTFKGDHLSQIRCAGYRRALETNGLRSNPDFIYYKSDEDIWDRYSAGFELGKQIAASINRPAALFAYNDMMAAGLQSGLQAAGLQLARRHGDRGF